MWYASPGCRVKVFFKPEGVKRYETDEKLTVRFSVEGFTGRSDLFKVARKEVVNQGIVDRDILEDYWEPYEFSVEG